MNSTKTTARLIGALYLISTASFLIGSLLIDPIFTSPDFLASLHPVNSARLSTGVFLQFVNDAAIVGIGVMMLRILRKYNEAIAVGVLSARVIEAVILVAGGLSLLLLITISQEFIKTGTSDTSYFQTLAVLARKWNSWSFETAMLALGLGGFFLCYLLYKTKLVPRLITLLGFVGYPILFGNILLGFLGYKTGISVVTAGIFAGLFELIFPLWLLAKGFNTSDIEQIGERES
jgi:hypothetical protein